MIKKYYGYGSSEEPDDDAVLCDSAGNEYGQCITCERMLPLVSIIWSGECHNCNNNKKEG